MKRHLLIPALILVPLAGPAQADPVLDFALARFRTGVGHVDHNGWRIVDARVEGSTLIVAMAPPAGDSSFTAEDLLVTASSGWCDVRPPSQFFSNGRRLRVELLSGGGVAASGELAACPSDPAVVTRVTARTLQRRAGLRIGGAHLASARAENAALVIVLDGPAGWRGGQTREQLETSLFRGYCLNSDTRFFFNGSRTVRFDTLENGRALISGHAFSSCAGYRE
jgi:hypothetical protein